MKNILFIVLLSLFSVLVMILMFCLLHGDDGHYSRSDFHELFLYVFIYVGIPLLPICIIYCILLLLLKRRKFYLVNMVIIILTIISFILSQFISILGGLDILASLAFTLSLLLLIYQKMNGDNQISNTDILDA